MSYVCKADTRYDRSVLSEIEEKYFPNLPSEEKIEFGFDEARTEGRKQGFKDGIKQGIGQEIEQGIEQVAIRLLQSGKMSNGDICELTGLSERQLLKIKHKIN